MYQRGIIRRIGTYCPGFDIHFLKGIYGASDLSYVRLVVRYIPGSDLNINDDSVFSIKSLM